MGFSEILVTRHLMHRHKAIQREPPRPIGYIFYVCGPHGTGYQQASAQIRLTSPHEFPWNRLDQLVCGWDCDLDLGLRLRCKRFALLDFHEQLEDSMRRLLSAPAGTQRLLSAAMAMNESFLKTSSASTGGGVAMPSGASTGSSLAGLHNTPPPASVPTAFERAGATALIRSQASTLTGNRFERFVAAVSSRLPITDRVQWMDATTEVPHHQVPSPATGFAVGVAADPGATVKAAGAGNTQRDMSPPRTRRCLIDMTSNRVISDAAGGGIGIANEHAQLGARRMFVQLLFDASACADACWHLEIRWNMCRGDKVEELIKYCARRAKQAGTLLLQVPTGRRPRPFSPPVLVLVPTKLQPRALLELRRRLCFVRESWHAMGDLHAGRAHRGPIPGA